MKRMLSIVVLCFFLFPGATVLAQAAAPAAAAPAAVPQDVDADMRANLRLASSSIEYPVTPGDVYRLSYRQADATITSDFQVEGDFSINLGVFGRMNSTGKKFFELKQSVEKLISSGYPRSMPSMVIVSLGVFRVPVKGDVPSVSYFSAWGLSRLSDVLEKSRGPHFSVRNVQVASRSGESKSYDLFRATRFGEQDQDPFLRNGDTVILRRSERSVTLQGEVRYPGNYQMLKAEGLSEILESYGGGLLASSDPSRIRIDKTSGERVRALYFDARESYREAPPLDDGDTVTVAPKSLGTDFVFFEGAILSETARLPPTAGQQVETTSQATNVPYNRLIHSYKEGETLSDALASVRKSVSPLADLAGAFIVRVGRNSPIPLDLGKLLEGVDKSEDVALQPFDRVVIPVVQFSVSVYGEVSKIGPFPFAPQKKFQYYVDLAGPGVENILENIIIRDPQGNLRDPDAFIEPQDRIYVTSSFVSAEGAVFAPGRFPFRRGLPPTYYVSLAGGIDPERNSSGKVKVFDKNGAPRKLSEGVQPGDQVYVPMDSFLYNFNKYFPVIGSVIGVVGTSLAVITSVIVLTR